MFGSHGLVRVLCIAGIALLCGAWIQPPQEARVNVGIGYIKKVPAKDYAALYVTYARMASIAYTDRPFLLENECPSINKIITRPTETQLQKDRNMRNGPWIAELNRQGWRCDFGRKDPLDCPAGAPNCNPVSGLQYQVWRRVTGPRSCEIVLAIRGTDFDEWGDWRSNLRWFLKFVPSLDEYQELRLQLPRILQNAARKCRNVKMIATGHSLGGALAQHAAYAAPKIRYVYAFDPSPVTAYFDLNAVQREQGRTKLGIDRIYEVGEVLGNIRYFFAGFTQPKFCNPRFRTVRFNATAVGGPVTQHSIGDLAQNLGKLAKSGNPRKAEGFSRAANCVQGEEQ